MTDAEMVESTLRGLVSELGLPSMAADEFAELAATLAEKLKGKGWHDAIQAGAAARAAVKTEEDAERSRRARTSGAGVVLLAAALALYPVKASAADDAPLADLPGRSVRLHAGEVAPYTGRLLSDEEHVKSEAACADDHAKVKAAESSVLIHPLALVGVVVLAIGAGVALGFGVDAARHK